jgi:hypothetical protein
MKKTNPVIITFIIALGALVTLAAYILLNLVTAQVTNSNGIVFLSIFLVIAVIIGSILVIIQTVREKQQNQPDNHKVTTETKSIGIRIKVADEDVSIEAPDAESAIKMLQVIFNGKSSLKVESGLTNEVKEPEERDAPETKRDEE